MEINSSKKNKKIGKTPNYCDDETLKSNQNPTNRTAMAWGICVCIVCECFSRVDDYIRRLANLI